MRIFGIEIIGVWEILRKKDLPRLGMSVNEDLPENFFSKAEAERWLRENGYRQNGELFLIP